MDDETGMEGFLIAKGIDPTPFIEVKKRIGKKKKISDVRIAIASNRSLEREDLEGVVIVAASYAGEHYMIQGDDESAADFLRSFARGT